MVSLYGCRTTLTAENVGCRGHTSQHESTRPDKCRPDIQFFGMAYRAIFQYSMIRWRAHTAAAIVLHILCQLNSSRECEVVPD